MSQAMVSGEIDILPAHELSIELLHHFEEEQTPANIAVIALLMTVGRAVSPRVLSEDDEVKWLENALMFVGTYFDEGAVH